MKRAAIAIAAPLAALVLPFVLMGAGRLVPAAPAMPMPDAAMTRGQQVFDKWCAPCHGRGPGHPGTQSLEVKYKGTIPAALEDRSDLSPEITRYFVRQGIALMPYFRKTEISDADLQALSAYLARQDEPSE